MGIFGDDAGRAVAFRPLKGRSRLIIAFRGVRVEPEALKSQAAQPVRSRKRSAGTALSERGIDVKNLLGTQSATADWLPAPEMRVHDGVLRHHESLWAMQREGRQRVEWKTVAAAVAEQANASASPTERKINYLGDWLPEQAEVKELVFVGLSLGAALAQISALRAAVEIPHLARKVHVLGLGAVQWANHATALCYSTTFGDRAVQLVNTASDAGPAPQHTGWWVAEPSRRRDSEAEETRFGKRCERIATDRRSTLRIWREGDAL